MNNCRSPKPLGGHSPYAEPIARAVVQTNARKTRVDDSGIGSNHRVVDTVCRTRDFVANDRGAATTTRRRPREPHGGVRTHRREFARHTRSRYRDRDCRCRGAQPIIVAQRTHTERVLRAVGESGYDIGSNVAHVGTDHAPGSAAIT